jgi:hypothetical protein
MKFLLHLWILQLMLLSFAPCCLGQDCHAEQALDIHTDNRDADHEGEEFPCCPSENCSICTGFTAVKFTLETQAPFSNYQQEKPGQLKSLQSNLLYLRIWQPPRLN